MTHVYFKEASGVVVVFSITSRKTLEGAIRWKAEVDAKLNPTGDHPIPAILLANKSDIGGSRTITEEEIDQVSKEHGFLAWFETSAKENSNIIEAMNTLVACMIPNHNPQAQEKDMDIVSLNTSFEVEKNSKCC
eukprot:TRINITY_DN2866_c0_g1_i1.p1 TRINITY_DN2866_c0_g1~~TRINITY_DN2866_c0_g1_i1.p1  ORF type:complete len:134 (-),score=26.27 TRINITY_DN2866_c0_g1_i1:242-643(-)